MNGISPKMKRLNLCLVTVATAVITIIGLVLAQMTHSITLLVLVEQNIYNIITLIVSLITIKLNSAENSLKNTFGWARMEVVGSLASLVFLSSLCFASFIECLQTLFHTSHLDTIHHPEWIMGVAAGNVVVWIFTFVVLGGYTNHQNEAVRNTTREKHSQNHATSRKCRFSEIFRDLVGPFLTIGTACTVHFHVVNDDYSAYMDPVIGVVYILILICTSIPIIKQSCLILLQTIPGNVEIEVLNKVLLKKFTGILAIHEMHIWSLSANKLVITAHAVYANKKKYLEIHENVEDFFQNQGFSQVTIQPEFVLQEHPSELDLITCNLKCKAKECEDKQCCDHALNALRNQSKSQIEDQDQDDVNIPLRQYLEHM